MSAPHAPAHPGAAVVPAATLYRLSAWCLIGSFVLSLAGGLAHPVVDGESPSSHLLPTRLVVRETAPLPREPPRGAGPALARLFQVRLRHSRRFVTNQERVDIMSLHLFSEFTKIRSF